MPFAPENISGVVEVLVASDIAQSDGSSIASWVGRVASSSFAQSTGTKQPTYRTSSINTHPAADFDGGDILVYAGTLTTANTGHVFVLVHFDDISVQRALVTSDDNAGTADSIVFQANNLGSGAPQVYKTQAVGGLTSRTGPSNSLTTTPVYLIEYNSDGSTWQVRINGVVRSTTLLGSHDGDWFGDVPNRDHVTVGGLRLNGSDSNFLDGQVGVVVIVDGAISDSDRDQFYQWLNSNYGTTIQTMTGTLHRQLHIVPAFAQTLAGTLHRQLHIVTARASVFAGTIHRQLHIVPAQSGTLAGTLHRRLHIVTAAIIPTVGTLHRQLHVVTARAPLYAGTLHDRLRIVSATSSVTLHIRLHIVPAFAGNRAATLHRTLHIVPAVPTTGPARVTLTLGRAGEATLRLGRTTEVSAVLGTASRVDLTLGKM